MTIERAKRLAEQWASGGVCTLSEGEAQEYHRLFLSMLLGKQDVVRCGECVHQYRQDYGPLAGARFCNVWCMINGMGDDGFCNYGEPKEGDDNDRTETR